MGQYYMAIIIHENDSNEPECIMAFLEAFSGTGMKLMEHSYIENPFVNTFEYLLTKDGLFHKTRVVWAGDYADPEKGYDNMNLYNITEKYPDKSLNNLNIPVKNTEDYHYIVNHTKKQYVDKQKQKMYHPLPLLTAEGNGRGGGDFRGKGKDLIGTWARDVLSVEKVIPDNYTELICEFQEE